jgi:hypothetical protein
VPRSVAIDESPVKAALIDREGHRAIAAETDDGQGSGLLLQRMRTMSDMGLPLLDRFKVMKAHHMELALAASPRARATDGTRYKVLRTAVVRAGHALDSEQVGVVHAGSEIVAVQERSTVKGDSAQQSLRVRFADGWVSGRVASGGARGSEPILQLVTDPRSTEETEPAGGSATVLSEVTHVVGEGVDRPLDVVVCSEVTKIGRERLGQMQHTIYWSNGSEADAAAVDDSGTWMNLVGVGARGARVCTGLPHRDVVRLLRSAPRPLELQLTSLPEQPLEEDQPRSIGSNIPPPVESGLTRSACSLNKKPQGSRGARICGSIGRLLGTAPVPGGRLRFMTPHIWSPISSRFARLRQLVGLRLVGTGSWT